MKLTDLNIGDIEGFTSRVKQLKKQLKNMKGQMNGWFDQQLEIFKREQ